MSPISKYHEIEAGEIDDEGKPYNRKRGVDQVYSQRRSSTEDDPFAEYERLSRSKRRDGSNERYSHQHHSQSRRRHSRDFESNKNNKDKRENSHVSYRGDNNNNRRSRAPINSNHTSNKKYATTIDDEAKR